MSRHNTVSTHFERTGELFIGDYARAGDVDDTAAFKRLLESDKANPVGYKHANRVGVTIRLGPRTYNISETIEISRAHNIVGCSGRGWSSATRIIANKDKTAFRFMGFGEAVDKGLGMGAGGARLSGVAVYSAGRTSRAEGGDRFGALVEANVSIEQCLFQNFTLGVHASADVNRTPKTNANGFMLQEVQCIENEVAGMFFVGGDTNGFSVLHCDANSNAWCAKKYGLLDRWPVAANFVDRSFLGGTFVGCHAATAMDYADREIRYPGWVLGDANQLSVLIGCYSEHDQLPDVLGEHSTVIGGQRLWPDNGQCIRGQRMSGADFISSQGRVMFGERSGGIMAVAHHLVPAWPIRVKAEGDYFKVDTANLGATVALRIGATGKELGRWFWTKVGTGSWCG